MTKSVVVVIIALILTSVAASQDKTKPWTDWSMKETTRILSDSAWAQTQVQTKEAEGSTSAITTTTGSPRSMTPKDPSKDTPGAITSYVKYFIRFLSARPIRQAVVRKMQLEQPEFYAQQAGALKSFAEATSSDYIVIAVAAEAKDQSMGAAAQQAFKSAKLESLQATTYLERKDGARVQLIDLKPPVPDGLGAKFVFPRRLKNEPFISAEDGYVRFVSQLSNTVKLEARFKVSEMMYNGKLEY